MKSVLHTNKAFVSSFEDPLGTKAAGQNGTFVFHVIVEKVNTLIV